ncbi:hypothetical protein J6590_019734 [Homalodisca vitripennis]|nr:hypothetical protein J6590_019734 [Homalodisca vitripennis]
MVLSIKVAKNLNKNKTTLSTQISSYPSDGGPRWVRAARACRPLIVHHESLKHPFFGISGLNCRVRPNVVHDPCKLPLGLVFGVIEHAVQCTTVAAAPRLLLRALLIVY